MQDTVVIGGDISLKDTIDGDASLQGVQDGQSGTVYNYGTVNDVDYEKHVYNRPSIEGVELIRNKTFKQLGLETATVQEVEAILYLD